MLQARRRALRLGSSLALAARQTGSPPVCTLLPVLTASSRAGAPAACRPRPSLLPAAAQALLSARSATSASEPARSAAAPPPPGEQRPSGGGDPWLPDEPPSAANAGWTRREVLNLPNGLSAGRALAGPVVAHLILTAQPQPALLLLSLAALSDWADGALARHMQLTTVLGSYLDPLADKLFVACLVSALAAEGLLPLPLAAAMLGRDVVLVAGAFAARWRAVGRVWGGWRDFFRLVGDGAVSPAAPRMQPLLVSKANTALTFGLVGAAVAHQGWGLPGAGALEAGAWAVAATTALSGGAYLRLYLASRR